MSRSRVRVATAAALVAAAQLAVLMAAFAMPRAAEAQPDRAPDARAGNPATLQGEVVGVERDAEAGRFVMAVNVPGAPEGQPSPIVELIATGENPESVNIAAEIESLDTPPTVILVVDTSGSMAGERLDDAKLAANECLNRLPNYAGVGMVAYADEPHAVVEPSVDRQPVLDLIDAMVAQGETATFDAVIAAARLIPSGSASSIEERASRFLILLTDGEDTVSVAPADTAVFALDRSGFQLFALGVDPVASADADSTLNVLTVGATGTLVNGDPEDLGPICSAIAERIASRYRVSIPLEQAPIGAFDLRLRFGEMVIDIPVPEPVNPVPPGQQATLIPGGPQPTPTPTPIPPTPVVAEPLPPLAAPTPDPYSTIEDRKAPVVARPQAEAPTAAENQAAEVGLWLGAASLVGAPTLILLTMRVETGLPQALTGLRRESGQSGSRLSRVALPVGRLLERTRLNAVIDRRLELAGASLRPGEMVVIVGSIALGLAMTVSLFGLSSLAMLMLIVVPAIAWVWLGRRIRRRSEKFQDQLGDTLMLLSGALRAGHSTAQALAVAAEKAPSPNSEEFQRVVAEVRLGRDLVPALGDMADRMQSEDAAWVVGAIGLNRELGGNLAATLDNVAATIMARAEVKSQVKIMSAEGRMTAAILMALPLVVSVLLQFVNPGYLGVLFSDRIGNIILGLALGLMGVGGFWISRLVKLEY